MRKFAAILMLVTLAFGADEIKRPTADNDPGAQTWSTTNCGIGTYAANTTTGTLARDAAGQTTSVAYARAGAASTAFITSRQFQTWTATSQTYTALTLNVNSAGTISGVGGGTACVVYSLNSGTSWTALRCDNVSGWGQTTDTISLSAAQNLTTVRVGVCMLGNSGAGVLADKGSAGVTLYDIWTDGVYSVTASGTGNTGRVRRPGLVL